MYKGYNKIFWGTLITIFNIKLGIITILPPFIGFVIILNGINLLHKRTNIESFNKAKIFGIIMSIIALIGEIMRVLSIKLSNSFVLNQLGPVFSNTIQLIMFYKLFEGSIQYLNNNVDNDLALENTKKLKYYIIGSVISIVFLNFTILFNRKFFNTIVFLMFFAMNIYLTMSVNQLKKLFGKNPELD